MELPENYTLLVKNVKHIGIRVSRDQRVRIVVPQGTREDFLEYILKQREGWIQKHLQRFGARKRSLPLADNHILFRGRVYRFEEVEQMHRTVDVDDVNGVIRSGEFFRQPIHRYAWYKHQARTFFGSRIQQLADQHGFQYNRIFIRSQKTRWGSCSRRKNLSLNWRLIKAPLFVIDYLILHELVHTVIMNHSRQYWQKVESLSPSYTSAVVWLKEHGREL